MRIILVLCLLIFSGCSRQVILHPITDDDIMIVPAGTLVGEVAVKKDGYYFSEFYVQNVMDVKIEN